MDKTNPSHPEFWNSRFLGGKTPWDFGGVPADLQKFLKSRPKGSNPSQRSRVLIPGCGSGHEIAAFAAAGFEVTALDFAPAAVALARKHAGPALAKNIIAGNFFEYDFPAASFDYIYERTFLCSLLPDRRPAYRDRVAQLLKYRGILLGFFFYQVPVLKDGPPFGFPWGAADELFARYFLLGKDEPATDSLPLFAKRERWQEWHRTSFCG
jgi:SAM-dependent methyltransferase